MEVGVGASVPDYRVLSTTVLSCPDVCMTPFHCSAAPTKRPEVLGLVADGLVRETVVTKRGWLRSCSGPPFETWNQSLPCKALAESRGASLC